MVHSKYFTHLLGLYRNALAMFVFIKRISTLKCLPAWLLQFLTDPSALLPNPEPYYYSLKPRGHSILVQGLCPYILYIKCHCFQILLRKY
jgi:hypothetical protein